MKFSCDKNSLCETINNVSLAVAAKSPMIALEGILLSCKNNTLTLTGYNLELGIIKSIPVNCMEEGEIILTASLLSNIANRMPSGEITLTSDSKLLTVIRCGEVEFTILGLNPEDYPEIPTISDEKELVLGQEAFREMIAQTIFAVAQTEETPVYTGTLFDVEPGTLSIVSVDGYRLAMKKEKISLNDKFNFVVPRKTLNEIQKLLTKLISDSEEEGQIKIRISNKHIIFELGGYQVISRLLEGEFLDYRSAIPKDWKTRVKVSTRDFIDSINRASIIINDRAKSPIKCEFSENNVKLNCETTLGKIQAVFQSEMEGDDVRIGFNNKYMFDALKASECDMVLIEMNGPLAPMKVLPVDGDSFLFLVLPVRLKD